MQMLYVCNDAGPRLGTVRKSEALTLISYFDYDSGMKLTSDMTGFPNEACIFPLRLLGDKSESLKAPNIQLIHISIKRNTEHAVSFLSVNEFVFPWNSLIY